MKFGLILSAVLLGTAVACVGGGVQLGDTAPALQVEKWLKGDAVDLKAAKGKHVYVVEFWATWCPPCRKSIPHLTELQKKYKDQGVVIVGVSVDSAEGPKPTRADVPAFVEKQGEKMDYVVALDSKDSDTAKAYLEAFLIDTIPTAFIVDQAGKLVWVGHPSELDKPLDQVLAGKYDLKAAQKEDQERRAEIETQAKFEEAVGKYFEIATDDAKPAGLEQAGADALEKIGRNAELLNMFAWEILTNEEVQHRDLKFALKVARLAVDASSAKDPAILDTYARALWDNGEKQAALGQQRKAVELAKDNEDQRDELKETLTRYEKELGDKPAKEKPDRKEPAEKPRKDPAE